MGCACGQLYIEVKMQLPLPPYGDIVKTFIKFNPVTPFYIFVGKDAWADARASIKNSTAAMCLPLGKKPQDYDWPVQNCAFIVYDTGGVTIDYLTDFTCYLLSSGARQITLFSELAPLQIFHQKDLKQ